LFGFIDIIALVDDSILAIQATTLSNSSSRVKKIGTDCIEQAIRWIHCGGKIEVWAWHRYAQPVDGRIWRPKVTVIDQEKLDGFRRTSQED
jgi:hypothetical protein